MCEDQIELGHAVTVLEFPGDDGVSNRSGHSEIHRSEITESAVLPTCVGHDRLETFDRLLNALGHVRLPSRLYVTSSWAAIIVSMS